VGEPTPPRPWTTFHGDKSGHPNREKYALINVYSPASPLVLRHLVNGKDGFVILPEGKDDDGIYFEDRPTLVAWVNRLVDQVGGVDTADIEDYDTWLKSH
jgi:hypothetical protein